MREKLLHSLYASLEWRVIAFVITNLFFWATTSSFWKATGLAFLLQLILWAAHLSWHFVRQEDGFASLRITPKRSDTPHV